MRSHLFRLLAFCLLLTTPAAGHEIGDSQIIVETGGGTWTARIVTAPTPLVNRLEQAAGLLPSQNLTQESANARLSELSPTLPQHLRVRIDDLPASATLVVEQLAMPADQSQPSYLVLRAQGALPAEASTLSWQFSLLPGQHALLLAGRTHWVDGDRATGPLPIRPGPPPALVQVMGQYIHLGFIHILPDGHDHVLFVLGLVLLTTRLRPLLIQVTAFTAAHSLTLALALYGIVELPARIVEPLIALSIAYVAVENIFARRLTPWRPALVFGFGLLHGLGFAGVLAELGLPPDDQVAALIAFNIGIELGQLAVIALAYALVLHWSMEQRWFHRRIVTPASAAITLVGLYWTVERVMGG